MVDTVTIQMALSHINVFTKRDEFSVLLYAFHYVRWTIIQVT